MRSEAPPLLPIFRSVHQASLLAWLFMHPADEYSLTEIAVRLGIPLTTAQREVDRLMRADLLMGRHVGRTRLIRANTGHRAADPLTRLLEISFGPQVVIEEEFRLSGAEKVILYGSWASRFAGTPGGPPHDIDVLVIGSPSRTDVYDAADRSQERLGLEVNPVIRTWQQWTQDADPLITQIKESPTVEVIDAEFGS